MKLALQTAVAGLWIGLASGCVETLYGGGSLMAPPMVRSAMADPFFDGIAESEPSVQTAEPSGQWIWIDGAWRWIANPAMAAQPMPPTTSGASKDVSLRVQLSVTTSSQQAVGATMNVTTNGSPSLPVSAQWSVTTSTARSGSQGAPSETSALSPSSSGALPVTPAALAPSPVLAAQSLAPTRWITTPDAIAPAPQADAPLVVQTSGPEEIRSAPAAGDITGANDNREVAVVTVLPMRTSAVRPHRYFAR